MKNIGRLSLFAGALAADLAAENSSAHHSFSSCTTGPECLAKATGHFNAGNISESLLYLHAAMEGNCPVIYREEETTYVFPEMQESESRADCMATIALYCLTLPTDMHSLSCLFGRYYGESWDAEAKPIADQILADNRMTFLEYLRQDKIDWYREINIPMLKVLYGISLK
jgi:hypothetical protein